MAGRVQIRIRLPRIPTPGKVRDSIDKFMGRAFRFAVRSAIRAHINQIHIESGMARGTFLFISKLVRAGANFPTNPGFKYYHRAGSNAQPKSAKLGASYSTASSRDAAQARFKFTGNKYSFEMQTALRYFNIEDQVRWNFSGPFVQTMVQKLKEFIAKNRKSLLGDIYGSATRGRGVR